MLEESLELRELESLKTAVGSLLGTGLPGFQFPSSMCMPLTSQDTSSCARKVCHLNGGQVAYR